MDWLERSWEFVVVMPWWYWLLIAWLVVLVVIVVFMKGAAKGRDKEEQDISHQLLHEEAESIIRAAHPLTPHRPDWDEYFLLIAQAVSTRGECTRSQVGAVIVRDRRIVATGYNGVAAGAPSCLDGICPRANYDVPKGSLYEGKGFCVATHAEENAIKDAINRRLSVKGTTIYLTKQPCEMCDKLLKSMQMKAVWPNG